MELINHLSPEQILLSVDVRDKWELIDIMVEAIAKHPICKRQTQKVAEHIREYVIEREKRSPTYMGHDAALPHARIEHFRGFAVCMAVLKNEIEWGEHGEPVRIACMVLSSEENPTIILKVMSALAHLLLDEETKRMFHEELNSSALYKYLCDKHVNVDVSILARDIMRTDFPSVRPNTQLRRVTHRMFVNGVEAIAVVDEDGKFHGEITCEELLKRGLPDFFNQLMSVSFIRDFDPFEKYFEQESKYTALDVATMNCAIADEHTTMMEIVYLLAIRKYPQVYVVNLGVLRGTIDRTTVLDQILNL